MSQEQTLTETGIGKEGRGRGGDISFICDKSVTTQNFAFLSYWYRKKRLQMHF
jgi:hypothetical protein